MLPSSRAGRAAQNGALVVFSLILALLLGELLVRRVAPQQRALSVALHGLYVPDADLGYRMRPGFSRRVHGGEFESDVRTNSLGLRDRELPARRLGTLRLVGLGDSFTFGVHAGALEDCFVKQMERRINARLAARPLRSVDGREWHAAEVVNAGVDGYGTVQEVRQLRQLSDALQPDGVILAFYLGNDFTDNSGRTRMTVVDGYQMLEASAAGFQREFRPFDRRLRLYLHAHSELYLLLKDRLPHGPAANTAALAGDTTGARSKPFDYYIYDSGFADSMRRKPTPVLEAGMQATRQALRDLSAWRDAHGATALIVMIPAEQQVDPRARERWLHRFGLQASEFDFELPNYRLANLAQENDLGYIDLTAEFAARIARGDTLYLRTDTHWNRRGHAAAAEILAMPVLEILANQGHPLEPLVPPPASH